jgi:anti-anti-sigma factor
VTCRAPVGPVSQAFSIDLVTEGTSVIITLSGELDMSTAAELTEFANARPFEPGTHEIVVDLSRITFLDCTGLGSLIDLKKRAVSEAKRFELRSIPPRVARLFDLSGIGSYFVTGEQ